MGQLSVHCCQSRSLKSFRSPIAVLYDTPRAVILACQDVYKHHLQCNNIFVDVAEKSHIALVVREWHRLHPVCKCWYGMGCPSVSIRLNKNIRIFENFYSEQIADTTRTLSYIGWCL